MVYCSMEDVIVRMQDISDTPSEETVNAAIDDATVRINKKLKSRYVIIDKISVDDLKTVCCYFACCDILTKLYHGDDMPVNPNVYCKQANELLEDIIEEAINNDDIEPPNALCDVRHGKSGLYRNRGKLWQK